MPNMEAEGKPRLAVYNRLVRRWYFTVENGPRRPISDYTVHCRLQTNTASTPYWGTPFYHIPLPPNHSYEYQMSSYFASLDLNFITSFIWVFLNEFFSIIFLLYIYIDCLCC